MAPVIDCMKGSLFQWTEKAFQLIKTRLTIVPILVLPNFYLNYIVMLRKWTLE